MANEKVPTETEGPNADNEVSKAAKAAGAFDAKVDKENESAESNEKRINNVHSQDEGSQEKVLQVAQKQTGDDDNVAEGSSIAKSSKGSSIPKASGVHTRSQTAGQNKQSTGRVTALLPWRKSQRKTKQLVPLT